MKVRLSGMPSILRPASNKHLIGKHCRCGKAFWQADGRRMIRCMLGTISKKVLCKTCFDKEKKVR